MHNSDNNVYVMYTWATETAFKFMLNVLPQKMAKEKAMITKRIEPWYNG